MPWHPRHPQGRHPWPRQSNKLLLGVAWQYVRQGQKNCTFSWVEGRSLSSILNSEGDVYYEIHREKKSTKHSARQYPVEIQTRERFFLKVWKMNFWVLLTGCLTLKCLKVNGSIILLIFLWRHDDLNSLFDLKNVSALDTEWFSWPQPPWQPLFVGLIIKNNLNHVTCYKF